MSAAPVFSAASIAGCIFTVLVSIVLPVAALAVLKRKTGRGLLAALVGAVFAIGSLFAGVHFIVQGWMAPSFRWTNFIGMGEVAIMTPILVLAAVALAVIASAFSLAKYTKA